MSLDARAIVIGEALLDRVVRPDGTDTETPGGSPANVALTLGRLGRRPTFITDLGSDHGGRLIAEWLQKSRVEVNVLAPPNARTASATAHLDETGSARYEFDIVWELEGDIEQRADLVHVGSIGAIVQPGADTVFRFVETMRDNSTITYDPNVRPTLVADRSSAIERIESLVALADVVKASEDDLVWLYPHRSLEETSTEWLALGPAIVAVTLGSNGAFAVSASGRADCAATTVDVADTVGAGDTFMGTLIDGLMTADLCGAGHRSDLRGIGVDLMRRLLRRSAFAAAVTVSRVGTNPPWRDELELAFPSGVALVKTT
jgi:fructokinase